MVDQQLPLVSVIIPCYNYGRFIEETIKSVLHSDYGNIEIIIVDDGSNEPATIDILDKSIRLDNRIRLIKQQNKGLPGARNTGIKHSNGAYILPLDADDLIDSTYISKSVWHLETNKEIDFVYPYVQLFGKQNELWITEKYDFEILLHHNYIPASAIFRTQLWHAISQYDESMTLGYEDWEFWIRAGNHGYKGLLLKEPLFFYRKHDNSMLQDSRKKHKDIVEFIRNKHSALYNSSYKLKIFLYYLKKKGLPRINSIYNTAKKYTPDVLRKRASKYRHQMSIEAINPMDNSEHRNASIMKLKASHPGSTLFILPWLDVGGVEKVFLNIISNVNRQTTGNKYLMTTTPHSNPWSDKFIAVTDAIYHLPNFCRNENEMALFVADFIRANHVSKIHISNSRLGYRMTPFLKEQFPTIKIIDTLHMEEPHESWDYFRVSANFMDFIDRRVVLTESQKDRLISKYGEKDERIRVIPNGVAESNCRQGSTRNEIAFVGRLVDQKNPELFLEIVKCLREKGINNPVAILGQGPLESKVRRMANQMKLDKNLHFRGAVSDVPKYLCDHVTILIAPSRNEGLPVIGLEAMAARVLVVASSVPGWIDIIEDEIDGLIIKGSDAEIWSSRIISVMNNDAMKDSMVSLAASKVNERYLLRNMLQGYEDIYTDLVSG